MAKTGPGSGSPKSQHGAAIEEGTVIELPVRGRPRKSRPSGPPRFRIFIIDSGWNSVARRCCGTISRWSVDCTGKTRFISLAGRDRVILSIATGR